jgi:cation transport regulator ChaB
MTEVFQRRFRLSRCLISTTTESDLIRGNSAAEAQGGVVPKTTKSGQPKQDELPGTLKRSPRKAQETFAKAHDSAAETYDGDEERASRVAYSAVKHSFEKIGDHWEPKEKKGPSDPRAKNPDARRGNGQTFGGVDYEGHSKQELYERAAALNVQGRSRMTKAQLAAAIARKQD